MSDERRVACSTHRSPEGASGLPLLTFRLRPRTCPVVAVSRVRLQEHHVSDQGDEPGHTGRRDRGGPSRRRHCVSSGRGGNPTTRADAFGDCEYVIQACYSLEPDSSGARGEPTYNSRRPRSMHERYRSPNLGRRPYRCCCGCSRGRLALT
ncbi:hypothetical protein SEA_BADAGARTUDE_6 [Mycobacterium phage BadAgartude]|nr:hypothetical protein SEA_BADAGARTUDE_6 [Mycobacterium phage BadAgartude]